MHVPDERQCLHDDKNCQQNRSGPEECLENAISRVPSCDEVGGGDWQPEVPQLRKDRRKKKQEGKIAAIGRAKQARIENAADDQQSLADNCGEHRSPRRDP